MKDRSPLRKEFAEKDKIAQDEKQHRDRTAQLEEIQSLLIDGFNTLIKFIDGKTTKTEVINQLKHYATTEDIKSIVDSVKNLDKTTLSTKINVTPLLQALKGIHDEIATIEKKSPEQKDSVKVSNLDEIKLDTSAVEKAIKALDLKVDVKAPIIKVDKPDLKPIQDIMLDLLQAFNKQKQALQEGGSVKIKNLEDIPLADLTKVEKKLDEANKLLKNISEKRFGGGSGGGGNGTPYIDSEGKPKNVVLEEDGSMPVSLAPLTTIYSGSKTVPVSTSQAIASTQSISSVTIKALSTNTVSVYVGGSEVTSASGFELEPGDSISLDIDNLADVFVISGSAFQVVRYIGV